MKKILSCLCALTVCVAMLSACGTRESTTQTGTASNSETTSSAEVESEATASEADTESTTEETEAEEEINYQKKRVVTYPVDGESYVSHEYEYGDDGYYKEIRYNSDGNISFFNEYKSDILVNYTMYYNGFVKSVTEYDESKINYITKMSQYYDDSQELMDDMFWDYQFNEDQTEALVTSTMVYYNWADTGEMYEPDPSYYIYKCEYDEDGHIIHKYNYDEELDQISSEYYYEYDDNGNIVMENTLNIFIATYEYDDNNLIHYNSSSSNSSSDTYYDYDEYGRQIGWTEYDADGNEKSHSVVEY